MVVFPTHVLARPFNGPCWVTSAPLRRGSNRFNYLNFSFLETDVVFCVTLATTSSISCTLVVAGWFASHPRGLIASCCQSLHWSAQ